MHLREMVNLHDFRIPTIKASTLCPGCLALMVGMLIEKLDVYTLCLTPCLDRHCPWIPGRRSRFCGIMMILIGHGGGRGQLGDLAEG